MENHIYTDMENYMYPIYSSISDLETDISNYTYQVSQGTHGYRKKLSEDKIKTLLGNQTFKNSLVLAKFNNNLVVDEDRKMTEMTQKLLELIDLEIKKG